VTSTHRQIELLAALLAALLVGVGTLVGITATLVGLPAFTHPAADLGEEWEQTDRALRLVPAGMPGWEQVIVQRTWQTDAPTADIVATLEETLGGEAWDGRLDPRGQAGITDLGDGWELWRWTRGNEIVLEQRDPPLRTTIRVQLAEATAEIDVHLVAERRR